MDSREQFEKKTLWVVILTAVTMVVEIVFGLITRSMGLLADGIHMGSHTLAIGMSWIAYRFVRRLSAQNSQDNRSDSILSLSGYTSGLLLLIFAFLIIVEAVKRFISPIDIRFREAIFIAFLGLAVNIISAIILHHKKEHSDHNIRAAYLHVLADALTSVSAIIGLTAAWIWHISYIDSVAGLVSSLVIIRWSAGLIWSSGKRLTGF